MIYLTKKQMGASLVEILIATLIFSIAAIGTFSALSTMRQESNLSERNIQAAFYAQQLIDELRGNIDQSTWDDWTTHLSLTCDGDVYPWPGSTPSNPFFDDFGGHADYACQDIPPGIRQVNLIITWDDS